MTMLLRLACVLRLVTTGAMLTRAWNSASVSCGAPPAVSSVMLLAVTEATL